MISDVFNIWLGANTHINNIWWDEERPNPATQAARETVYWFMQGETLMGSLARMHREIIEDSESHND